MMWVNAPALSEYKVLVEQGIFDTNTLLQLVLYGDAPGLVFVDYNLLPGSPHLHVNTWYHLAYVVTPSNTKQIFVNGLLTSEVTQPPFIGTSNNMQIGHLPDFEIFFGGMLDEIAIWQRQLSSEEIASVYKTTIHVAGGACNSNADCLSGTCANKHCA